MRGEIERGLSVKRETFQVVKRIPFSRRIIIKKHTTIAIFEILTAIGIITFWIVFLTTDVLYPTNMPKCYLNHEFSFPIADFILGAVLILSSILLIKQKALGIKLSLVSAGAMIFLGILDTTYNLQNGLFFTSIVDGITLAIISLWVIIFGLIIIIKLKQKS